MAILPEPRLCDEVGGLFLAAAASRLLGEGSAIVGGVLAVPLFGFRLFGDDQGSLLVLA